MLSIGVVTPCGLLVEIMNLSMLLSTTLEPSITENKLNSVAFTVSSMTVLKMSISSFWRDKRQSAMVFNVLSGFLPGGEVNISFRSLTVASLTLVSMCERKSSLVMAFPNVLCLLGK